MNPQHLLHTKASLLYWLNALSGLVDLMALTLPVAIFTGPHYRKFQYYSIKLGYFWMFQSSFQSKGNKGSGLIVHSFPSCYPTANFQLEVSPTNTPMSAVGDAVIDSVGNGHCCRLVHLTDCVMVGVFTHCSRFDTRLT